MLDILKRRCGQVSMGLVSALVTRLGSLAIKIV